MAGVRWSTEIVAADYKDLQASTMALESSGTLVLLAGRKYLALVKLDKPLEVAKAMSRQSKWEVTTAEWNPHITHENMFAIACNQRAELITYHEGQMTMVQSLRAHTRIIGDVNWSPFDPNFLATCSVDNYTYIWDIRDCRRPAISLFSIAGASQVKWNKVSNNLIATSNEGDVRLWDHRRSTTPLLYLAAHTKKISSLDWNPTEEFQLATASQECTVKTWNISNARRVENINTINSTFPVWRARYTPFGQGLVTVVLPQLRRGENSIFLWNLGNIAAPVHTFVGHTDVIWEFAWRQQKEDRDYQLVSWAKDYWLRIWRLDRQLQKLCGHDADMTDTSDPDLAASDPIDILNAGNETIQAEEAYSYGMSSLSSVMPGEKQELASNIQPRTLQQEFSLVNINIPNVTVDEMDAVKRSCTASCVSGRDLVKLQLHFPATYPFNAPPTFHLCEATTIDSAMKAEILTALRTTSEQHVKRNRSCLEPCLRQLKSTLDACILRDQEAGLENSSNSYRMESSTPLFLPATNVYGSFQDGAVPFPRTSGARFCGAGYLVSFSRPLHLKRMSNPGEVTPRSLSALFAYAINPIHSAPSNLIYSPVTQSSSTETAVSVSSYYYPDRKHRVRGKSIRESESQGVESKPTKAGVVIIYDMSTILPLNRGLAQTYVVDPKNIPSMCKKNAAAAANAGRRDLVQVWSLVGLMANPRLTTNSDSEIPWVQHPFGKKLLQSIMSHYTQIGDIQTVAMLCCMFAPNFPEKPSFPKKTARIADTAVYTHISGKWWLKPGGSPYHTIHPGDTNMDGWNLGALMKSRSNSWSDSLDDHDLRYNGANVLDQRENPRENVKPKSCIQFLDPKQSNQYDQFKKSYAEILYHWNLLQNRTHILKFVKGSPEHFSSIEFATTCENCGTDVHGSQCKICKNYSFHCDICHVAVRGASNYCIQCGHGGHALHMLNWFADNDSCPVGCGCICIEENHPVD